jgi:tetratricopeptide (TPR) repeat protein
MSAHVERGRLLMQQGRLDQAVQEFGSALIEDPANATAHGCLALCLSDLGRYDEAERAAVEAVRHGPDRDIGHYALGAIALERDRLDEAHRAASEALRIGPTDAFNFGLMARVHIAGERWEDARKASEAGLRCDPAHVQCLNLHSLALQQLGRPAEARAVIESALARDPENAATQATAGWAALKAGDAARALQHFKEALRIDPKLDHARSGVVESIKAKNALYAIMLRYLFWMGRLSKTAQWAVVIGGMIGFRMLRQVARTNPSIAAWIWPVLVIFVAFVFFTLTSQSLSNLLLRLHPFGRLALTREEVVATNRMGACIAGALAALLWRALTNPEAGLIAATGALFLGLPVVVVLSCQAEWRRRAAGLFAVLLGAVGITIVALWVTAPNRAAGQAASGTLGMAFVLGAMGATWLLLSRRRSDPIIAPAPEDVRTQTNS